MSLLIGHAAVADVTGAYSSQEVVGKSRGHVTLSDEEYERLAVNSAEEVRQLCASLDSWNLHSNYNGIEIYERRSTAVEALENMLLLSVSLPSTMEKLEKLLTPWGEYRQQWDTILERAELINSWPEKEVFLVRHLVRKMFPMSARESIDIVKIIRSPDEVVFGCCSTVHGKYPPTKAYVRTHQYVGGYVFRPCTSNENHTRFYMLFHADLNLPGPRFISDMAGKFKPKLMAQKIDNLKQGIKKFDI